MKRVGGGAALIFVLTATDAAVESAGAAAKPQRVEPDHVGQDEQLNHIYSLATAALNPRQPLLRLVKGGDNVLLR